MKKCALSLQKSVKAVSAEGNIFNIHEVGRASV